MNVLKFKIILLLSTLFIGIVKAQIKSNLKIKEKNSNESSKTLENKIAIVTKWDILSSTKKVKSEVKKYNNAGNLIEKCNYYESGKLFYIQKYIYDKKNNLVSIHGGYSIKLLDKLTTYKYDSLGLKIEEQVTKGSKFESKTRYINSYINNQIVIKKLNEKDTCICVDKINFSKSIIDGNREYYSGHCLLKDSVCYEKYTYDDFNNLKTKIIYDYDNGNHLICNYYYNLKINKLISIEVIENKSLIDKWEYVYDNKDNLLTEKHYKDNKEENTYLYTYQYKK